MDPPKDDAQPISFTEPGVTSPSDAVPSLSDAINSPSDALPTMGDYITPARCTYFQADGLYWGRVGTGCNQVLAIDSNATSGSDTLLQTSNLNFNGTGGMRLLFGWTPDPCRGCTRCCAYEVGYFGLFGWQAHARVQGSGNLAIPGDLGVASNNFFGADALDINYRSSLHNLEFNCVKTCCLCDATLDFLCGFRFITLQERFTIAGTDLQEGTSSYDVKANNYLYGGQLGGRYTRHYSCWSLQLTGKAGVFLNDMSQSQVVTDFPNVGGPFFLRNRIRADGTGVAALGEIGATAIRPINDTWSLRLGYMALGLGGVALAPDQLDFTDNFNSGSNLQKNGWIFVHGAVMGAEARW
ncbi:MAG: BBP7 family outer membrane beta-barrel protein [Planctomycetales bacterium]|nr:BBP7 family outer membrane beta-barrel protein [Planctomycetales bacterium]